MELKKFADYANSFQAIARLELESITLLLDYLGHPERELKFIHVAGTNGKGSVCNFLQEIFTHAGYRCGKFISPNMISVCERISIDGEEISEKELDALFGKAEIASEKVKEKLGEPPTQFEIWTAAAFCYFKEKNCDMVILETGLGGSRDATNVIPAPEASVITRIAMDHTGYLGNTLSEIAAQKAGIIKKGGITVTCPQSEDIMQVLKNSCINKNNPLKICDLPSIHTPKGMNEVISYKDFEQIEIGIPGYHQIENACIAIEAALALNVDKDSIRYGIEHAKNIGRLEPIEENVIFDGAHNPNGMTALVASLKRYFPDTTPVFIMGMMADKDISAVARILNNAYKTAAVYTVAVADNPRSETAQKLAEKLNAAGFDALACSDMRKAYVMAKEKRTITVICGSLYLYKDFKEMQLSQKI